MSQDNQTGREDMEKFPRIVKVEGAVDEMKEMVKEFYLALYLKEHERYDTQKIFALALTAAEEFQKNYKELNTRVNINFEEQLKEHVSDEAVEEVVGRKDR
jgi:hypothetical protein